MDLVFLAGRLEPGDVAAHGTEDSTRGAYEFESMELGKRA